MKKLFLTLCVALVALTLGAQPAAAGPLVQLGFLVDSSGSIGSSNFTTMKNGMANAFSNVLPTDGSVEVTVVQFGQGVGTVVAPTLIDSAATLTAVVTAVQSMNFTAVGTAQTRLDLGIQSLNSQILSSPTAGAQQIYNVVTDGLPTFQSNATNSRNQAIALGLDEFDAEFIGSIGSSGYNYLAQNIVYPQPLSPPFDPGFIVPVSFANFEAAFEAKLVAVTNPVPEPGTLLLMGAGLFGLGARMRRRRKS